MANAGDGSSWDETDPADSAPIPDGAKQIRDIRKALDLRLKKEHEQPVDGTITTGKLGSTGGGEHLPGSAKAYWSAAASVPLFRPDTVTVFDADDAGRLWLINDANTLEFLDASGNWQHLLWGNNNLVDNGVSGVKITDATIIASTKLVDASISEAKLNNSIVTTVKIADGNVTLAKLVSGIFTADATGRGKFASGFITTALIAAATASPAHVGTYTGNGSSTQAITIGFQADMVLIVRSDAAGKIYLGFRAEATHPAAFPTSNAFTKITGGLDFGATTFTVNTPGSDFTLNANGVFYFYIAIRSDS